MRLSARLLTLGLLLLTPAGARAQKWSPPTPEASTPSGGESWRHYFGGVVTRGADNNIYLLFSLSPFPSETPVYHVSWMTAAPQPSGNPSGDAGTIVYRGVDAHIYKLTLPDTGQLPNIATNNFVVEDLTTVALAPLAASDPSGLLDPWTVDTDPPNSSPFVAYRGVDHHLHVLYPQRGTWWSTDLTATTNAPAAIGTPVVYVRLDRKIAIYYRSADGHVHETLKGTSWTGATDRDLTVLAGAPVAVDDVSAYQRRCHINDVCGYPDKDTVVYRGPAGRIFEMTRSQTTGQWLTYDLTAQANAPAAVGRPIGYQRWYVMDHTEAFAVVFRSGDGHIHELALDVDKTDRNGIPIANPGWKLRDLTVASGGAALAAGDLAVFRSPFNAYSNSIVYRAVDGRLHRIWKFSETPTQPWYSGLVYDGVSIP